MATQTKPSVLERARRQLAGTGAHFTAAGRQLARTRRRVGRVPVAVLALGLVIVAGSLTSVLLLGGGPPAPIATGAARIVPSDALLYLNLSVDPSRPVVAEGARLARQPRYRGVVGPLEARFEALLTGGARRSGFPGDARAWLGHEAAFALLNTAGQASSPVLVLEVSDRGQAQAFVTRWHARRWGAYGGLALYRYPDRTELALVRRYLVLGADGAVRAVIDTARRRASSLAADAGFRRASAGESPGRLLDLYASAAGLQRVVGRLGGLVGALAPLVSGPDVIGAAMAVSLDRGALRAHLHVVFDPALAALHPFPRPIASSLMSSVPAGSSLAVEVSDMRSAAPAILATAARLGVAGRLGPLLARLGGALSAEGVNLGRVLDLFAGDTVLAVGPAPRHSVIIITQASDTLGIRGMLAELEAPLGGLLASPGSQPGQARPWTGQLIEGIPVRQLVIAPNLQLDYAVARGQLVISTSVDGVAAVLERRGSVRIPDTGRGTISSLVFLNLSQLLVLGQRTGLTHFGELQPALDRIGAVGLRSRRQEADTTAELFLQIP